ncbi:MAG: hypothetical protein ABIG96_03915 [Candidatus Micrarchaeota archaeon]
MRELEAQLQAEAKEDLEAMEAQMRRIFVKHMVKISLMPPRRHMKFGLPFNVENVTKQARLIYQMEDNTLYILRCFATHKEYEKWYNSFK